MDTNNKYDKNKVKGRIDRKTILEKFYTQILNKEYIVSNSGFDQNFIPSQIQELGKTKKKKKETYPKETYPPNNKRQEKKERKKKKEKIYFPPEMDTLLVTYQELDNPVKKNIFFNSHLLRPFEKLAENLVNVYVKRYIDDDERRGICTDLIECFIFSLEKFDPKKGRLFTFLTIVGKNFLFSQRKKGKESFISDIVFDYKQEKFRMDEDYIDNEQENTLTESRNDHERMLLEDYFIEKEKELKDILTELHNSTSSEKERILCSILILFIVNPFMRTVLSKQDDIEKKLLTLSKQIDSTIKKSDVCQFLNTIRTTLKIEFKHSQII